MATKIVTKNSSTAGSAPLASDLVQGELAVNVTDKRLYTENASGTIVEVGTNPSTIDINSGTIDGTVIGGTTAAAGSFTTVGATGNITVGGTVDGRDVATDGTKLDGIEALADVTDTANVTAAGALMDSELANITAVKALDQGVATTDSPSFAGLTASGEITANGGIALGDNDKATFGDGDDLQIYHDGSNSYIRDTGTGNLNISADQLRVLNAGNNEIKAAFTTDGAVDLYHNNLLKLATTSTGIDVTGTATMDGLNVQNGSNAGITFDLTTNYSPVIKGSQAVSDLYLAGVGGGGVNIFTTDKSRLLVQNNGDISFYEDTGTTPKLFWDASAESLGIGNSAPVSYQTGPVVSIGNTTDTYSQLNLTSSTSGKNYIGFGDATSGTGRYQGLITYDHSANIMGFGTAASTAYQLSIDSSGNVGIGTSSPATNLHIQSASEPAITLFHTGIMASQIGLDSTGSLTFGIDGSTGATERMRIDSSGNVGIGTSSSTVWNGASGTKLLVGGASNTITSLQSSSTAINQGGIFEAYSTAVTSGSAALGSIAFLRENTSTTAASSYTSFFTNNGGTVGERMRIDSSGNVGIGTTGAVGAKLVLSDASALEQRVLHEGNGTTVLRREGAVSYLLSESGAVGNRILAFGNQSGAGGAITETARIDSSGNLLVGGTTTNAEGSFTIRPNTSNGSCLVQINRNGTTATSNAFVFYDEGVGVGSITYNNTSTAYNTSSDQRLKDNIVDADDAGSKIDAIQVRQYDWKADGLHQDYGMIAQELQAVAPEAVSGDVDSEEMMGVDYSKLVPMLIKEIQSLRNRVAQLEG